jgi:NTP pyrophosphatase (non-canonical NTP hydrolase)
MCRRIFEHYGIQSQRRQLIEECAELIQAISKFERKAERFDKSFMQARDELLGEIADVKIMIEQIELCCFGREAVAEVVEQKLRRQIARFEEE